GGFIGSESDLARRLEALDDRLTVGGRLWLQTTARVPDGVDDVDQVALDAPNLLDLFVDARPNDRVRAYAQARLQHDWTVSSGASDPFTGAALSPDRVLLDQLWTKFDVGHRVYVTAGKQRIRWGAGRFWNPTDFMNQQRLDPLAILDVRTGVDLLKVHVPVESANANVYALANLTDAADLSHVGGAVRAEWSTGQTEVTASAAARADQPVLLGADLSSGVGPFDLRAEAAVQHGANGPFYEGTLDLASFQLPTEVDRSEEWLLQLVVGAEWSLRLSADDSISFGVEWFHNELGYGDADLYPWLFANSAYLPLYIGRDYAAGYVFLAGPGRWDDHTFVGSGLVNVSDGSAVARLDWRGQVLTWLQPTVYGQLHFGENGEFHYAIDIPAAPIPGLEDGLKVPAPLFDLGVGAIVEF
ncbi:MAG: hypothetical protein ABMA64_34175, partial [Myxococcota bacterium]